MSFDFLERIRQKPLRTRRIIHISLTVGLTSVIALFWWIGNQATQPVLYVNTEVPASEASPSRSLTERVLGEKGTQIKQIMSGFGESVAQVIDAIVEWRDETIVFE